MHKGSVELNQKRNSSDYGQVHNMNIRAKNKRIHSTLQEMDTAEEMFVLKWASS
jgi:hypothetical protein